MCVEEYVEDEWYGVRYSGEIPEVAFHSALHYLSCDDDGPGVELTKKQISHLVDAVKQRYIDIILRDLLPVNKHTGSYRGVRRSLINWKRFVLFCEQYDLDDGPLRRVVGETLSEFLEYELKEYDRDGNNITLNCTWEELLEYIHLLDLKAEHLPDGSRKLCSSRDEEW